VRVLRNLSLAALTSVACACAAGASDSTTGAGHVLVGDVVQVLDGDTIRVRLPEGREHVRYIGIDAPEIAHRGTRAEPYGAEAAGANRRFVSGQSVTLELDQVTRDRYGRLLAYVYDERDELVNALLVEHGLARVWEIPPNVKHASELRMLEAIARSRRLGIWSKPDTRQTLRKDPVAYEESSETVCDSSPPGARCRRGHEACRPVTRVPGALRSCSLFKSGRCKGRGLIARTPRDHFGMRLAHQ
jgi:micrococcal nuclease